MINPFKSVLELTKDKHYYLKQMIDATAVIYAASDADNYAARILYLATEAMDKNNECYVSYAELDSQLGIKQSKTRTKTLNILRLLNLVEITNGNRKGIVMFRINANAYSKIGDAKVINDKRYCEVLNTEIVDKYGRIDQKYIDTYRAYGKNQEKVEKYDGLPF